MDRRVLVELTNLCMVYDGDRILVQEKIWNGTKGIVFPGGHIEDGESLRDSVIREIKEETGLTIHHPVPCGFRDWITDDGTRYMVLLYKTNEFEGELRSSSEGRVFWVTREEFAQMNVIWHMHETLKILDSPQYSEYYYAADDEDGVLL